MEKEKKRKRTADRGGGERRTGKEVEEVAASASASASAAAAAALEDEVEEFFTILRRMRVAIKYFEKSGSHNKMTTELAGDRVDGVKIDGKRDNVVVENGGLDLNAVPEAEI